MIRSIFALVGCMLFLSACDGLVTEPLPEHTPQLVLNGFFEPDKPMDVYLSRSYGLLEQIDSAAQIMIEDATVELLEDGQVLAEMIYRDTIIDPFISFARDRRLGKYSAAGLTAESGKTYTVRATRSGYEPIEASTTIPFPANVLAVEIDQNVARVQEPFQQTSRSQSIARITLADPADIVNYYSFGISIWFFDSAFQSQSQTEILSIGLAERSDNGGFESGETIVSDQEFDGETATLEFLIDLPTSWLDRSEIYELAIDSIVVFSTSSNHDYAQYSIKKRQQAGGLGGFDFFPSESVVVYDNVEGGFGILGGFVIRRDKFPG
ncbi:MAG: DUF4249 domain-containing protein [Bacteroidota bacterium]